jgi:hypothetical protein
MVRIAITGHRGLTDATAQLIDAVLRAEIGRRPGELLGLTYLAEGADTLFARAVLDARGLGRGRPAARGAARAAIS